MSMSNPPLERLSELSGLLFSSYLPPVILFMRSFAYTRTLSKYIPCM